MPRMRGAEQVGFGRMRKLWRKFKPIKKIKNMSELIKNFWNAPANEKYNEYTLKHLGKYYMVRGDNGWGLTPKQERWADTINEVIDEVVNGDGNDYTIYCDGVKQCHTTGGYGTNEAFWDWVDSEKSKSAKQAAATLGRLGAQTTNARHKDKKSEWCRKGGLAGKGKKKPRKAKAPI